MERNFNVYGLTYDYCNRVNSPFPTDQPVGPSLWGKESLKIDERDGLTHGLVNSGEKNPVLDHVSRKILSLKGLRERKTLYNKTGVR